MSTPNDPRMSSAGASALTALGLCLLPIGTVVMCLAYLVYNR